MVNKSVVISEEIANISDSQLQKRLKEEFNYSCGPITATTKGIYIKKLQEFINSNVTTAKSTPVRQTNVPTPKTRRKTLATPIVDVEIKKPELTKPNRRASVGRSPSRSKAANKIEIKTIISNFSDSEAEDLVVNESKPNTSVNGQTALEYSRGNRLLKRTINSRISSVTPTKKSLSPTRSTTLASATSKQKQQQDTIPRNDSFSSDDSVKKAGGVEVSYSVKKTPTSSRAFRLFNRTSSLSNYSDSENEETNNLINDKKEASSFTENITKRLLRHRPTFNSLNSTKSTLTSKDYPSTKYLNNNNQPIVSQVNQNDANQSSSSYITQSNWIPKSILIAVILFFAFIFSFYFYSRFISSIGLNVEETELNALEKEFDINFQDLIIPGCLKTNDTNAICSANQVRPVLLIIKEMKNIVDRKLTNYYCSSSGGNLKENPYEYSTKLLRNQIEMSIGKNIVEIARQLRTDKTKAAEPTDIFLSLFANALDLLNSNSNLHMKPIGENGNYEKILIDSNYPKPLHATCLVKLFMYRTIWWFVILVTISGVLFSMYLYLNRLKNEKNKEKEVIYDLVNKSIELLQSPDEPQPLPILHVRDMLLDPSQRKLPYYQRIWDEVVYFIENNESRVKSSLENIDGEDYKTWKWVAASKNQPDSTVMKSTNSNTQMNEWQNNVFSDDNTSSTTVQSQQMSNEKPSRTINTSTPIKNNSSNLVSSSQLKDFVALTRFLKVRNMVDQQTVELDDDWRLNLCNSILEMCSKQSMDGKSHGIQHIHVDDRNDGLVYIKCDSIETASNAFKVLHGTVQALQEKKLVSVKFLKEERYYNRFPEAENLNKILKSAEI